MENEILENLCNKIVDIAHETFTKKIYFVKILQSKKCRIYLTIRKKRERDLLGMKKTPFLKTCLMSSGVFLNGTVTDINFWEKTNSSTKN